MDGNKVEEKENSYKSIVELRQTVTSKWKQVFENNPEITLPELVLPLFEEKLNNHGGSFSQDIWDRVISIINRLDCHQSKLELQVNCFTHELHKILLDIASNSGANHSFSLVVQDTICGLLGHDIDGQGNILYFNIRMPVDLPQITYKVVAQQVEKIVIARHLDRDNDRDEVCKEFFADFIHSFLLDEDQKKKGEIRWHRFKKKYTSNPQGYRGYVAEVVKSFFNNKYNKLMPHKVKTLRLLNNLFSPDSLIKLDNRTCKKDGEAGWSDSNIVHLYNDISKYYTDKYAASQAGKTDLNILIWKGRRDNPALFEYCFASDNSITQVATFTQQNCLKSKIKTKSRNAKDYWRFLNDHFVRKRVPAITWSDRTPIDARAICISSSNFKNSIEDFSDIETRKYLLDAKKTLLEKYPDITFIKGETAENDEQNLSAVIHQMIIDIAKKNKTEKGWISFMDIQTVIIDDLLPPEWDQTRPSVIINTCDTDSDDDRQGQEIVLPDDKHSIEDDFEATYESRGIALFKQLTIDDVAIFLVGSYFGYSHDGFPRKNIFNFFNDPVERKNKKAQLCESLGKTKLFSCGDIANCVDNLFSEGVTKSRIDRCRNKIMALKNKI